MWLTPEHPDPKGSSLAILATALKHLIVGGRRWGVFWDFLSLHQFPEQGRRLPEDALPPTPKALWAQRSLFGALAKVGSSFAQLPYIASKSLFEYQ